MINEKLNYYTVTKIDTIKELIELAVKEAGNKIAFEYKNKKDIVKVTYKEFSEDINSLGTALSTINLLDSHIAVIGENSYNWITVYLTVLESNGVLVPVDKELTVKEIINVLRSSDSEALFYSSRYEKYINEIKKELPNIKYFIGFGEEEDKDNILSYKNFMEKEKKS